MSEDDSWAGFIQSCEAPPAVEGAGTLTAETMRRWLDEMLQPRRPVIPWGYRDLLEDLPQEPEAGHCRAVLFAPDDRVRQAVKRELITRGIAVHPVHAAWLDAPVQGPAPLRCALGEHPAGTWHWDGRSVWFR